MKRFLWVFAALLAAAYVMLPSTAQARPISDDGEPVACWIGKCLEANSVVLPAPITVVPTATATAPVATSTVAQKITATSTTEPASPAPTPATAPTPVSQPEPAPVPPTAIVTPVPQPSATPTWTPTLRPWPTATPIGTVAPTFTATSTATWTATNTTVPTSTATATPDLRPAITSVSTNEAHPGDWVVIRGQNLLIPGVDINTLTIWLVHDNGGVYWWGINSNTGKPISPDFWDQDSIQFQIPADAPAQSGRLIVTVGSWFDEWEQRFYITAFCPTTTSTPTATATPTPTKVPEPTEIPIIFSVTDVQPSMIQPGGQMQIHGINMISAFTHPETMKVLLRRFDGTYLELAGVSPRHNLYEWTATSIVVTLSSYTGEERGNIVIRINTTEVVWPEVFVISRQPTPTRTATVTSTSVPPTWTPTATATSTPTATRTHTPTATPAPVHVQFVNPQHFLSHPNGISYSRAEDATLSINGTGDRFELKLVRTTDERVIAEQNYTPRTFANGELICLFGQNSRGCNSWPQGIFTPGSYEFRAVAYTGSSYNSNFRRVYIQESSLVFPTVRSLSQENGRVVIRGFGFRTYTSLETFRVEVRSADVQGIIQPSWNPGTTWSDGEISFPRPTWFPRNGEVAVWANTLRSSWFEYQLMVSPTATPSPTQTSTVTATRTTVPSSTPTTVPTETGTTVR